MKFIYPTLSVLFTSLIAASPFTDKSKTSVKLSSDPSNVNNFIVNVKRIDEISNKNGEVLAERLYSVNLNFEVEDDMLLLNGKKAAPLGESVITTINATYVQAGLSDWQTKIVTSQFDEGILSISLASSVEDFAIIDETKMSSSPILGRHITIKEKILELNGKQIQQEEFVEHVLDLYQDGTLVRQISDTLSSKDTKRGGHHHGHHHKHSKPQSMKYRYNGIDLLELLTYICYGALGGLLVSMLIYVPVFGYIYYRRNYTQEYEQVANEDLPVYSEKPEFDLPKYIPVVTEDKEEKITVYEALAESDDEEESK
ncbi:hypothetical protein K502DRAFT_326430 [Neoconidiobolus thromboides FSU 785]|nr:hypothetical protein K502DRAFT_326430 [Neoconidiobolus thromboides FSU 785]